MPSEKNKVLEQFLKDVDEQISYQPMHAAINEELRAHVEDKAEMYQEFGIEQNLAYEKAVRDMGDASALGIQMNEAHHLRIAKPLLGLILILTIIGLIRELMDFSFFNTFDCIYYLWGMLVLGIVIMWGYPALLKYANEILFIFAAGILILLGLIFTGRVMDVLPVNGILFRIFQPTLRFGILQLIIPVLTVLLYRKRKAGMKSLALFFVFEAGMILMAKFTYMSDYAFIPIVTMVFSGAGVVFYMVIKDYLAVEKIRGIAATVIGTVLILALFCGLQWETILESLQMFVNPNERAAVTNAWDDSYNNVLIQELLGRAELFGEIQLSEEELVRYGTSQWYYEAEGGQWNEESSPSFSVYENKLYCMNVPNGPELEDILPQHYKNNYRIAWWILKHGWIPAICLIFIVIAAQGMMFWTAFHIRNRLGRLVAVAGSLVFLIQNLFYFLGNFGFQFGAFGNLPFVSEGWVSITGTMIIAGLVLSAYRFDTVVKEESI